MPTAALTTPAWATAAASAVNLPPSTVPLRFSTVHAGAPGSAISAPLASNARAVSAMLSPGLRISSVGVTSNAAGTPAGSAGAAAGFATGFAAGLPGAIFGPMA